MFKVTNSVQGFFVSSCQAFVIYLKCLTLKWHKNGHKLQYYKINVLVPVFTHAQEGHPSVPLGPSLSCCLQVLMQRVVEGQSSTGGFVSPNNFIPFSFNSRKIYGDTFT